MRKLLKGTYEIKKHTESVTAEDCADVSAEFEARASEKLGGSIAFVRKGGLLWAGDDEKTE